MENILHGPPLESDFWHDLDLSLGNYILRYIRNNEDRVYMINAETEKQLKLSELAEYSTNLAVNLQKLGCARDINAAIYLENCTEYMIAFLGITLSGATVVTFDCSYTLDDLQHSVSLAKPKIIFCSRDNFQKAKEVRKIFPFIEYLITINNDVPLDTNTLPLSDLIQTTTEQLIQPVHDENATAIILFSSGTTGSPKGVMISHRNMLYMLKIKKFYNLFAFDGQIAVSVRPMCHDYGIVINLLTIVKGQTLVFLKTYDKQFYISLIEKYKVEFLYLVPTDVLFLLKTDLIHHYDISSVKQVTCGAAALKATVENEIIRRLNLDRFQQGYGMTESTLSLTIKRKGNHKPGTCGTVVPGCRAKVVDPQTGKILGTGQTGELCFDGPGVMKGYLDNPAATADTIRDGWLHTGDLGYYDEDGDFFIVDRLKEVIKYKGFQVAPAELENVLINHPQVEDAGVIGIPDTIASELPKAFVVKKPNATITEKELQDYVDGKVSSHMRLKGGVTFVPEIPKNPTGKILRRKLRELSLIGAI